MVSTRQNSQVGLSRRRSRGKSNKKPWFTVMQEGPDGEDFLLTRFDRFMQQALDLWLTMEELPTPLLSSDGSPRLDNFDLPMLDSEAYKDTPEYYFKVGRGALYLTMPILREAWWHEFEEMGKLEDDQEYLYVDPFTSSEHQDRQRTANSYRIEDFKGSPSLHPMYYPLRKMMKPGRGGRPPRIIRGPKIGLYFVTEDYAKAINRLESYQVFQERCERWSKGAEYEELIDRGLIPVSRGSKISTVMTLVHDALTHGPIMFDKEDIQEIMDREGADKFSKASREFYLRKWTKGRWNPPSDEERNAVGIRKEQLRENRLQKRTTTIERISQNIFINHAYNRMARGEPPKRTRRLNDWMFEFVRNQAEKQYKDPSLFFSYQDMYNEIIRYGEEDPFWGAANIPTGLRPDQQHAKCLKYTQQVGKDNSNAIFFRVGHNALKILPEFIDKLGFDLYVDESTEMEKNFKRLFNGLYFGQATWFTDLDLEKLFGGKGRTYLRYWLGDQSEPDDPDRLIQVYGRLNPGLSRDGDRDNPSPVIYIFTPQAYAKSRIFVNHDHDELPYRDDLINRIVYRVSPDWEDDELYHYLEDWSLLTSREEYIKKFMQESIEYEKETGDRLFRREALRKDKKGD